MTPLFTLSLRHQIHVHSISMVAFHILYIRQVLLTLPATCNPSPAIVVEVVLQSVLPVYLILCAACVYAKSLQSCLTLRPYGLDPTRLLCLWDSPGKNTGVSCHTLLQGIFLTQGSNPYPMSPALVDEFFTAEPSVKPLYVLHFLLIGLHASLSVVYSYSSQSNLHTTILQYPIQWILVCLQGDTTITTNSRTFSSPQKEALYLLAVSPRAPGNH